MPDIRFDQGDTGTVNESRNDIALGVEFDIVALNITGTAVFGLLGRPPGSAAAITGTGNTRQITGDVAGGYRVRISDDSGSDPVIHTFSVKTVLGLDLPAFNERSNPDANDVDTDPGTWVNDAETNQGGSSEGWHRKMVANLLLLESHFAALGFTQVLFVDSGTPTPTAEQSGRLDQKFATIEQAANAAATGVATALVISPGVYPEGFTVAGKCTLAITDKQIGLYSWGRWELGTSAAKVDIDITATPQASPLTSFSILAFENGTPGKGGVFSESLVPEIFGKINYALTGTQQLRGSFSCDIDGDAGGAAIAATAGSQIGAVFTRSRIGGTVIGDGIDIQDAQSSQFTGAVVIERLRRAVICQMEDNWTVTFVPPAGRVQGFINSHWDTGITFTGPVGSFIVDAYTNYSAVQNSVTLAGGATKVVIHDADTLPLAGGTMSGVLNMGSQAITNAGNVTATGFSGPLTGNVNDVAITDAGVATDFLNATGAYSIPQGQVPSARSLTAGAGLTGGGDLAADRTFNVVANADGSMVINADDLQVGVLATDAQHGLRGGGTQHAVATGGANGFMSSTDKTAFDLGPFLPLTGGTMSGALLMGSNAIQSVSALGVGVATPVASALVELSSTTQGFLPPRMTTAQRDAIVSPATGLELYNTTTNEAQCFNGSIWATAGGDTTIYNGDGTIDTSAAQRVVTVDAGVSSSDGLLFNALSGGNDDIAEFFIGNQLIDARVTNDDGLTHTGFDVDTIDGIRIFDGTNEIGAFYHADYSTQGIAVKGDRWIPDAEFVNRKGSPLTFGGGNVQASGTAPRYLVPGFDEGLVGTTELFVEDWPFDSTIDQLRGTWGAASGSVNVVFVLRVEAADTALTFTALSDGTSGSDFINSVAVPAGSRVSFAVVKSAATGSAMIDLQVSMRVVAS